MPYQVDVDYSPAYELISSFTIYLKRKWTRNLDIGASWLQQVDETIDAGLRKRISELKDSVCTDDLLLLAWACPERERAEGFLQWFATRTPGQLYETMAPYATGPMKCDLQQFRDQYAGLLMEWNEQYYRQSEEKQAAILREDYERKREQAARTDASAFVERSTGGLIVHDSKGLERIVLTPSLHFRPMNNYCAFRGMSIIQYPVDPPVTDPDAPPLSLMRLTRALSDESRIRILRFLKEGTRSFTEIVQFAGISKGTVHHHMTHLRAAGLVRTHVKGSQPDRFSIRTDGLSELSTVLKAYLQLDS